MFPSDISVVWLLWVVSCPLGQTVTPDGKADRASAVRGILILPLNFPLSLPPLNASCCPHTLLLWKLAGSEAAALRLLGAGALGS